MIGRFPGETSCLTMAWAVMDPSSSPEAGASGSPCLIVTPSPPSSPPGRSPMQPRRSPNLPVPKSLPRQTFYSRSGTRPASGRLANIRLAFHRSGFGPRRSSLNEPSSADWSLLRPSALPHLERAPLRLVVPDNRQVSVPDNRLLIRAPASGRRSRSRRPAEPERPGLYRRSGDRSRRLGMERGAGVQVAFSPLAFVVWATLIPQGGRTKAGSNQASTARLE